MSPRPAWMNGGVKISKVKSQLLPGKMPIDVAPRSYDYCKILKRRHASHLNHRLDKSRKDLRDFLRRTAALRFLRSRCRCAIRCQEKLGAFLKGLHWSMTSVLELRTSKSDRDDAPWARLSTGMTSRPSTTAASPALSAGTTSPRSDRSLAASNLHVDRHRLDAQ